MTENWQAVAEFPRYEISDLGRIRKIVTRGNRELRVPRIVQARTDRRGGYRIIAFYHDGRYYYRRVARLVLFTFVGAPPSPVHQAAHGDGCPTNDALTNLRWSTPRSNNADKVRHGTSLAGETAPAAKITASQASKVKELSRRGLPIASIAAASGVSARNVRNIRSGRTWMDVA